MKLLFLDFDGTSHPAFPLADRSDDDNQLFSCMPRIEAVLRDFPEWQVVISSSWREVHAFDILLEFFAEDIRSRVVGVTPVTKTATPPYPKHPRYEEIMHYLHDNPAQHWIALDDDANIFPPDCPNLIQCADGFWEEEEAALRKALERLP